MDDNISAKSPRPRRRGYKALKIIAWSVMGIVLYIIGLFLGVIGILTPERLTPLTEKIASDNLQNAEVHIGRVELTAVSSFPFIKAHVDDLTVLSTITRGMSADDRMEADIPDFADTVLTIKSFDGGLNVFKLMANRLDLTDVTIDGPAANLVVIDEETTNFDIIPPDEDEEPFDINDLPGITLRNFAITNPGLIRYYDIENMSDIGLQFSQIGLTGTQAPLYTLHINGNLDMPEEFYDAFNLDDLKFGLNGSFSWNRENPAVVQLQDFDFMFAFLSGRLNTSLDFNDGLKINTLSLNINPIDISKLLAVLPPDMAEEFGIDVEEIETDAKPSIDFAIKDAWLTTSDAMPPMQLTLKAAPCKFSGYGIATSDFAPVITINLRKPVNYDDMLVDAVADIHIAPCPLKFDTMDLNSFALDATITLPDGNPQDMVVDIQNMELKGPATDLQLQGRLTDPIGQMLFDGKITGKTDFAKFPRRLRNLIDGTLKGKMTANVEFRGSPSMFSASDFHRLALNGNMTVRDLYWVSGDTVNMVQVDRVSFKFGSAQSVVRNGVRTDSLLHASLKIDSATIVSSDMHIAFSDLALGMGAKNKTKNRYGRQSDYGLGGGINLKTFNLTNKADSAVLRIRDVNGYTFMRPYQGNIRTPEFEFDLDVARLATGDRSSRVIIRDANAHFNARRIAKGKRAKQFSHIADSVHNAHPELHPDSVMKIAYAIQQAQRDSNPRRQAQFHDNDSVEILDWGTSSMFKKMLTLWTFDGSLTSRRAGLFTPYLPLRNRFRNVDITFNNDSVLINGLQYKIGRSDMLFNGTVTNMRRAFTSISGRSPLRANFQITGDTIDINQLTEAFMAGSSYSAGRLDSTAVNLNRFGDDEEALERQLANTMQNAPDTMMPLLIPVNVDARLNLVANNVLYSDLLLRNLHGKLLTYNGALNLDSLSATSDAGTLGLSALYTGRDPNKLRFGFGLQLNDFRIDRFLQLVPAVDSILPVMRNMSGIINANLAATSDVDHSMNLVLPTLDAAVNIKGDSLVVIDPETFKTLSKWLMFKNKDRNIIDHADVSLVVRDSHIDVYPFIFNIDRYKLGIQGYNDFDMNFKYHIAVLKSPIPFKFGINLSGNSDKMKIRLGGAKFGEKQVHEIAVVDTTRVNLMREIQNVFKRGARDARLARLKVAGEPPSSAIDLSEDTLTHADSLRYIEQGLIPPPEMPADTDKSKKAKKRKQDINKSGLGVLIGAVTILTANTLRRRRKDKDAKK